jgi:elongation factor G
VISASDGLSIGNDLVFDYAKKEFNNPMMININMCDRDQSNFDSIITTLKDTVGRAVFPLMLPVNEGEGFSKVVDVLNMKLHTYKTDGTGTYESSDLDADLSSKVGSLYEEFIELIAESDEVLLEKYFKDGELSTEDIQNGIKNAIITQNLIPVFCTSATQNIGVLTMINMISSFAPTSADTKDPDAKGLSAFVFKTISQEHVGEISIFRIFSGELSAGQDVSNTIKNDNEKMRQLFASCGNERIELDKIVCGDIGCALKLKNTNTSDTLCATNESIKLKDISFPSDNMSFAIQLNSSGDEDKMGAALALMTHQDPTFKYRVDPELKQTIISGQGELHIDITLKRIKERFNIEFIKSIPNIPYRETITSNANAKYRHKKQSGGSGQFAEVWLRITPGKRGDGVDFQQSLVGQNVDRSFVPSVEKGIKALCEEGIISGSRVVDLKIDFYDGKMHPVDSNDMAFQIAGKHAFVDAFKAAKPKLLEPIYKLKIKVPDSHTGDVMGDISQRRGKVGGMDAEGHYQVINAEVPLANISDYAASLKSLTSGSGFFSQEFSHYQDMPVGEAQKVMTKFSNTNSSDEE